MDPFLPQVPGPAAEGGGGPAQPACHRGGEGGEVAAVGRTWLGPQGSGQGGVWQSGADNGLMPPNGMGSVQNRVKALASEFSLTPGILGVKFVKFDEQNKNRPVPFTGTLSNGKNYQMCANC